MKKTLNIGCGELTYKEYPEGYECVNIDERDLTGVDIVGDIRSLQLPDEEFHYILASDIIEHFPITETVPLLKEWSRTLKHGGIMEIRTPNMLWALDYYNNTGDAKFVSYHIFGGQDYPGNFHYVMFDIDWLTKVCAEAELILSKYDFIGSNIVANFYKK